MTCERRICSVCDARNAETSHGRVEGLARDDGPLSPASGGASLPSVCSSPFGLLMFSPVAVISTPFFECFWKFFAQNALNVFVLFGRRD